MNRTRGGLLRASAGGLAALALPVATVWATQERLPEDPVALGIASCLPMPPSIVLWTRLASKPDEPGSPRVHLA